MTKIDRAINVLQALNSGVNIILATGHRLASDGERVGYLFDVLDPNADKPLETEPKSTKLLFIDIALNDFIELCNDLPYDKYGEI